MIAVRIGDWKGIYDKDLVFFVNRKDVESLENYRKSENLSCITGELFSRFPYERLNDKISLRVDDDSRATAWGAGLGSDGFFIRTFVFYGLKNTGSYLGAVYDTFGDEINRKNYAIYDIIGNKISIVNYENEKAMKKGKIFKKMIDDLKQFQIIQ